MELNLPKSLASVGVSLEKSMQLSATGKEGEISLTFVLVLNRLEVTNMLQKADMFSRNKCYVNVETYTTPFFSKEGFRTFFFESV